MEYLTQQNRRNEGDVVPVEKAITAKDKRVVIIGGGDTGADCLGTVHRQGAKSVAQFELLPRPPDERAIDNPWPTWPHIFRVSAAHEEGGDRVYAVSTERFSGNDRDQVSRLHASKIDVTRKDERVSFDPIPGSEFAMDVDLVLLAMGFLGPERPGLLTELGVKLTARGNVWRDENWMTSVPSVFAAGDMQRGPITHRLGNRRGTERRARHRRPSDGDVRPASSRVGGSGLTQPSLLARSLERSQRVWLLDRAVRFAQ